MLDEADPRLLPQVGEPRAHTSLPTQQARASRQPSRPCCGSPCSSSYEESRTSTLRPRRFAPHRASARGAGNDDARWHSRLGLGGRSSTARRAGGSPPQRRALAPPRADVGGRQGLRSAVPSARRASSRRPVNHEIEMHRCPMPTIRARGGSARGGGRPRAPSVESQGRDAARLRETPRHPGAIRPTAKVVLSAIGHLPACWA
jgi:hypothetical protein